MPRGPKSPYDSRWRKVRLFVLDRDEGRCWECGGLADNVDHVVPVSEAPHLRLDPSNLRASCPKHNYGRVAGRLAAMAKMNRSTARARQW